MEQRQWPQQQWPQMYMTPRQSYTKHVSMPWYWQLAHLAMTIMTGGLWLPAWISCDRKWRREHAVTYFG